MLKDLIALILLSSLSVNSGSGQPKEFIKDSWKEQHILTLASYPEKKENSPSVIISAKSALALDVKSGIFLYEKNTDEKLPIASITKLMTAIIITEEEDLNALVKVSRNAAVTPGSKIWLYPGEVISVENLLAALLIHSANDAAVALAEFHAVTEEKFVKKMNQKAQKLGLKNTNFANATGLDNTENYSTARDISMLATYAIKKRIIRHFTAESNLKIQSQDGNLTHELKNTNEILGGPFNIIGLKTGNTEQAGPSLVALAKGSENHEVITVILNSENRFAETTELFNWIYQNYHW